MHAKIYTDSSIAGGRDVCAIAVRIVTEQYTVRFHFAQHDVVCEPEIEAVATALHYAATELTGISTVEVFTDFKILVRHLKGEVGLRGEGDRGMVALIKYYSATFTNVEVRWIKGHYAPASKLLRESKGVITDFIRNRIEFEKVDKTSRHVMRAFRDQHRQAEAISA